MSLTGYPSIDKPWLKFYTEEQISAPLPHMTAYEYLKKQNAGRLNTSAISGEFGNFTYRELFDMIDKTSAALWSIGIKKGKNVLSMFPVLPHESFLLYGIDAVGAALCQLAPQYTPSEICSYSNQLDADLFFTSDLVLTPEMERMLYENTQVRHIVVVNFLPLQCCDERTITWDTFLACGENTAMPEIHRDPNDVLFFATTSGSTNKPKCVMLNDNCFNIAVHQYLCSDLDYRPADRWMRFLPNFPASGVIANHHLPLCAGMHMMLRVFPQNVTDFVRLFLEDKPNHMMIFAPLLDELRRNALLKDADLSFIRTIGCGGVGITTQFEECIKDFFQKHNIDTFLGYGWGSTESSACAANRTNRETAVMGSAGAPMMYNIISAFDPNTGEECKYGEEGELCVCSPNLMMGYYNESDLTQKALRTMRTVLFGFIQAIWVLSMKTASLR